MGLTQYKNKLSSPGNKVTPGVLDYGEVPQKLPSKAVGGAANAGKGSLVRGGLGVVSTISNVC